MGRSTRDYLQQHHTFKVRLLSFECRTAASSQPISLIFHGRLPQSRPSTVVSPLASDGTGRENTPPLFANTFEALSMLCIHRYIREKCGRSADV